MKPNQPSAAPAMDAYTVRVPRWPTLLRLLGRDPLVRTTDRVQALISVLTIAAILLAAPIAASIGTEIYDARRHVYAAQAPIRHTVPGTVIDVPAPPRALGTTMVEIQARWTAAGVERTGAVTAPSTVEPGDSVTIWVDDAGAPVAAPTPTSRAAVEAVTVALVGWASFAAAAAALFTVTRAVCNRIRSAGWQHALDGLVGNGNGRTANQA